MRKLATTILFALGFAQVAAGHGFDYEKIGDCDGGQVTLDRYKVRLWSDGPSRTATRYQAVFTPEKRLLLEEMGFVAPEDPNGQFILSDLVYNAEQNSFETSRENIVRERSRLIVDPIQENILISQDAGFGPRTRSLNFGNCTLF